MTADRRRLGRIRGLALLIAALSLVVVAVSAYLRLDAAGLGCSDWPACYAGVLSGQPPALHYGFARLLHRVAASAALVLAIILVWQCRPPAPLAAAKPALWLLLLMLALAGLGFLSADPRRAFVGFLNIVGGLGLVSFSWRVALAAGPAAPAVPLRAWLLRAGVVMLTLTVVLGAWLGATYSAAACLSLPACDGAAEALRSGWSAFDPFVRLEAAPQAGEPRGVLLHVLHRLAALLTVLTLGAAVWRLRGTAVHRPVAAVLLLLAAVVGFGVAAVARGLDLWLVVGHGVAAAMLLAAVASLLRR